MRPALAFATAVFAALVLHSTGNAGPAVAASPPPSTPAKLGAARSSQPRTFAAEAAELVTAERSGVEALRASLMQATDARARLELQRRISQLKRDTEVNLLLLQARHAREQGQQELAQRLELAARELRAPASRQAPTAVRNAPRPAER